MVHVVFHVSSQQHKKFYAGDAINLTIDQLLGHGEDNDDSEILDVNINDVQVLRKIASSINTSKGMKFSPSMVQSGGGILKNILHKIGIRKAIAPVLNMAAPIITNKAKALAGTAATMLGQPELAGMASDMAGKMVGSELSSATGNGLFGDIFGKKAERKANQVLKRTGRSINRGLKNNNLKGLAHDIVDLGIQSAKNNNRVRDTLNNDLVRELLHNNRETLKNIGDRGADKYTTGELRDLIKHHIDPRRNQIELLPVVEDEDDDYEYDGLASIRGLNGGALRRKRGRPSRARSQQGVTNKLRGGSFLPLGR